MATLFFLGILLILVGAFLSVCAKHEGHFACGAALLVIGIICVGTVVKITKQEQEEKAIRKE